MASICALDVADADSPNYGYRPAMATIVNRMTEQLVAPTAPPADWARRGHFKLEVGWRCPEAVVW